MIQDHSTPHEEENGETNENIQRADDSERFESDTQKVVRQHLEDKDHVITEEDIANIRIGMTPPPDEATAARLKGDDAIEEVEKELLDNENATGENDRNTQDRITPWDTIDPK